MLFQANIYHKLIQIKEGIYKRYSFIHLDDFDVSFQGKIKTKQDIINIIKKDHLVKTLYWEYPGCKIKNEVFYIGTLLGEYLRIDQLNERKDYLGELIPISKWDN